MSIIKYREFTIRTEGDSQSVRKSASIQLRDRAGFHFGYYPTVECAERAVDGWWTWHAPKKVPIAERSKRLAGPRWTDDLGSHVVELRRFNATAGGCAKWQMVDFCDGAVFQVIEMPDKLETVCDTATGALWALRGIAASWIHDVRSHRGH